MIRRLTLVTNPDVCNLRCPLCFLNQRGRTFGMGEMPWSVAKAAVDEFWNAANDGVVGGLREIIPSTMGEPLLYSQFNELVNYCEKIGVPLNITTNGSFVNSWGTDAGMVRLLRACSDIKVSCMGFDERTFDEMMPGLTFARWRKNVERLCVLKKSSVEKNCVEETSRIATVSLQVTLHRGLISAAPEILKWAENIGINRVKWNLPVFLECAAGLRSRYGLDSTVIAELRSVLRSAKVRSEGSLFFDRSEETLRGPAMAEIQEDVCEFFKDEIWVMPDGSKQRCPNPERRFGNPNSAGATCENCVLMR